MVVHLNKFNSYQASLTSPPTPLQKEKGLKLTVAKGYSEICINLFE